MKLTHPNSMLVALAQQLIFIILVEVTFKTVKGTWVAAYLVLEFFIRMVCYAKLGVSVAHFFKMRSNACDSLATVADVLFLYLVLSGSSNDQVEIILSEELRIARSSALDVSGRFFRLLRLQRLIIFAVKLCVQPLISLGRLRCKGPSTHCNSRDAQHKMAAPLKPLIFRICSGVSGLRATHRLYGPSSRS